MAIKIRRPSRKISAVKEFTDRVEPRKAFWHRYMKMVNEGSSIINFYGAGGVGKTALLKKLEEEILLRDKRMGMKCKYVKYDFSQSTDMREVLMTLKFQLSTYGCKFPFFDTGNYYYSLKVGQDITPPKATSMLAKIPWVKELKKNLSKTSSITGSAMPVIGTIKKAINVATPKTENEIELFLKETSELLGSSMPVMRTITTLMSIADDLLIKYLESKKVLNEDVSAIRFQLNARRQDKDPCALYEYLPTLFAMDVGDWLEETENKLVVMFDNYESLISATASVTTEQLKRDLWIRGDDGLILGIPNTLWTIAGRNKLRWDGELAGEIEHHLITSLSPEDSDWFLQRAGIVNKTLRGELIKMTNGYPIFLDLCVDAYFRYKQCHDEEPSIAEFGEKLEDVVGRIFRYLDAEKDDAAKDMLEFLCALNAWTDELVIETAGAILPNFSRNTYRRVKSFSFIKSERIEHENVSLTIYRFDKTIQSLIIAYCKEEGKKHDDNLFEKLIDDVKNSATNYFQKKFTDKKSPDSQKIACLNILYLKLWAEFIIHLADNAEELSKRYKKFLNDKVLSLINGTRFDAAEEILKLFMNELERLEVADSDDYAHFELDLGWLRRAQGKYNEAYTIIKSACEKRTCLWGGKRIETVGEMNELAISLSERGRCFYALECVKAMHLLSISLRDIGRYTDALEWRKNILSLHRKFLGDKYPDILNAIDNLTISLSDLDHYDNTAELKEEIMSLIKAMNNLAVSLSDCGRHDDAAEYQKKVLALRKKILGDEHPDTINAMNNLAISLNSLGYYDDAAKYQKKVLALNEKIHGKEHFETIVAINNLTTSLINLRDYNQAMEYQKRAFILSKKILGKRHPITLDIIHNLANLLRDLKHYYKSLKLKKYLLVLRKTTLGNKHPDTIDVMNNLAISLSDCGHYKEAVELQKQALTLSKEILGEKHPNTIYAINNLAILVNFFDRLNGD